MHSFKKISLFVVLSVSLSAVSAVPLYKRIAQTISASTQQWEKACTAASGGQQCNPISVTAFSTLLAAAGPCDQQNSADAMIDLAKQLNNDADMIKFAQIFVQQPRNTPNSLAVPYCQQAPKNSELNGLFQCQFKGANQQTFVGGLQVGAQGTIPFGISAALDPAGSCPANPSGPIEDGTQLVDLTQDPGLQNVKSGGGGTGNETSSSDTPSPVASATDVPSATPSATDSTVDTAPTPTASVVVGGGGDTSDDGNGNDNDCGGGDTDSSDNSSLSTDLASASPSASSATVVVTPTITPTPTASSDSSLSSSVDVTPSASSSASGSTATGDFKLQNGKDAQALNAKFASLTADSTCSEGDQACVQGGFAQCVSGKFVVQQCSGGLTCAALPLVNKAGTSIACTTEADALSRIAASGATGGLTGN